MKKTYFSLALMENSNIYPRLGISQDTGVMKGRQCQQEAACSWEIAFRYRQISQLAPSTRLLRNGAPAKTSGARISEAPPRPCLPSPSFVRLRYEDEIRLFSTRLYTVALGNLPTFFSCTALPSLGTNWLVHNHDSNDIKDFWRAASRPASGKSLLWTYTAPTVEKEMATHALAILGATKSWNCQSSGQNSAQSRHAKTFVGRHYRIISSRRHVVK